MFGDEVRHVGSGGSRWLRVRARLCNTKNLLLWWYARRTFTHIRDGCAYYVCMRRKYTIIYINLRLAYFLEYYMFDDHQFRCSDNKKKTFERWERKTPASHKSITILNEMYLHPRPVIRRFVVCKWMVMPSFCRRIYRFGTPMHRRRSSCNAFRPPSPPPLLPTPEWVMCGPVIGAQFACDGSIFIWCRGECMCVCSACIRNQVKEGWRICWVSRN